MFFSFSILSIFHLVLFRFCDFKTVKCTSHFISLFLSMNFICIVVADCRSRSSDAICDIMLRFHVNISNVNLSAILTCSAIITCSLGWRRSKWLNKKKKKQICWRCCNGREHQQHYINPLCTIILDSTFADKHVLNLTLIPTIGLCRKWMISESSQ